jgi:hypothetical protein
MTTGSQGFGSSGGFPTFSGQEAKTTWPSFLDTVKGSSNFASSAPPPNPNAKPIFILPEEQKKLDKQKKEQDAQRKQFDLKPPVVIVPASLVAQASDFAPDQKV